MNKIYIVNMIDEEDSTYSYQFLVKENCEQLIEDCVEIFYMARLCDNFEDLLDTENYGILNIDERVMNFIKENKTHDVDFYGNAYLFAYEILKQNDLLVESGIINIKW